MTESIDLASAIKKLRGGRPQKEVYERAGIDASSWSAYEKGRLPRSRERFEDIARGLGCTYDRLIEVWWECRNERLQKESEETKDVPPQAEIDNPAQRAVQEGVEAIRRELEKLFLLAFDQNQR